MINSSCVKKDGKVRIIRLTPPVNRLPFPSAHPQIPCDDIPLLIRQRDERGLQNPVHP